MTAAVLEAYAGDPTQTVRCLPEADDRDKTSRDTADAPAWPAFIREASAVRVARDAKEVLVLQPSARDRPGGYGFELGETIGTGAMGVIHSAEQLALGREVAIKRLKHGGHSPARAMRLEREAALLSRLEHPNIPPVHLLGIDEAGHPAVVMKRITGVPWKAMVRGADHPAWSQVIGDRVPWLLRVFVQVCHAVAYAHARGVLHLDIKAENIMIGEFGEVYLIDWGISEWLREDGGLRRRSFAGTPSHAAPEMFFAASVLTPVTDVYLLGATLIEALTGRGVRTGRDLQHLLQSCLRPADIDFPDFVHPHLRDICLKAVALRPEERYGSANTLLNAVEAHLDLRDALETLREGHAHLDALRAAVSDESSTEQAIGQLGFQCRFSFEHALRKSGALEDATRGVLDTQEVLLGHHVARGKLEHARRLLTEMRQSGAAEARLERVRNLVDEAASARQRAEEIATQIQYRLMEELQSRPAKVPEAESGEPPEEG